MKKGKLLFELHGYKLKGKWTLVKLKKGEKEWLLIKEKDGYVSADSALPPESVLSGLAVEELKAGKDRAAPVLKALARLKAPRRVLTVEEAEPMLTETREQPFSKPGWLFELKLDGYRVRARREQGVARADRAARGPAQVSLALREGRRGAVRAGREDGARGDRREKGGRALPGGPLTQLAQDPRRPDRRLRGRGLHAAQGLALGVRRARPRRVPGREGGVRRASRQRVHRGTARGREYRPRAQRPPDARILRPGPARCRSHLGRAHADRGSQVQGMDGRGTAKAAGVREIPRRQADYGDRETRCGRRDAGCGAAGGSCASRIPPLASRGQVLQPRQSLLARRGLHQGRLDRVLPGHIPVDAALSRRSAPGAHALPRRHQREILFPEGRAGVCPGVRAHGHDLERGLAARARLFRLRQ